MEKVNNFLFDFVSAVQAGKIYCVEHPSFKEFVDRSFILLKEILKARKELVLGIVDEELACEGEIFFEVSRKLKPFLIYLRERGIERMSFLPDVRREELDSFISYLARPRGQVRGEIQEYLSLRGVKHITAGRILVPSSERREKEKPADVVVHYDTSLDALTQSIEKMVKEEDISLLDLKFNVLNMMDNLLGIHRELMNLISVKKKDLLTFCHLLNTSILAMYVSTKMGYSREDVLEIGTAALFHDIGKTTISRKIIKKDEALAKDEFTVMKKHTVKGAGLLLRYADTLGLLPAVVAFEHHLRYDLKGYPWLSYPIRPHFASLLVSVCDVYDALSQRRAYKRDFPPPKIYGIMAKERGALFDPELLDLFFRFIGVWPVGTVVALNDGRVAVVRGVNEEDIFRPRVEVVSPPEEREFIDLKETKKDLEIQNALDPFGEGKEYLEHLNRDGEI